MARNVRGFTFFESLIAVLLIGLTVAAFATVFQTTAKAEAMAGTYQRAVSLAQHKIDQLRAIGYGRLDASNLDAAGIIDHPVVSNPYSFTNVDNLSQLHPLAGGTIAISDLTYNVKQVVVTVGWNTGSPQRKDGDVTLSAFITKP